MPLTQLQTQTIKALVNVFETGHIAGQYGALTLLPGDTGHLSYGRSQASLGSGMLATLLEAYLAAPQAQFAAQLAPLMPRVRDRDSTLDSDPEFRRLLTQAGADPAMHAVQDAFFDRRYFLPACRSAEAAGVTTALGTAVAYDSFLQGGWEKLRAELPGAAQVGGEAEWIARYVALRRAWLRSLPEPVPQTVYRMDTFSRLIAAGNWQLELPVEAHGVVISSQDLAHDLAAPRG
jgi:chitosanase